MTDSSDAIGFEAVSDEDSEADRIEQATPVYPEPEDSLPVEVPLESDPADTVDQYREVPQDDDYPHE
ncbi:hypothetical protein [Rhodococcus yananensis]|uniref:hypothetical protein n=1 Tax=Rhodococcus yananensis TaxID=2879464 RepID=UPI001CF8FD0A|nr:hypothetical protein [Rhodococcus yananensis]